MVFVSVFLADILSGEVCNTFSKHQLEPRNGLAGSILKGKIVSGNACNGSEGVVYSTSSLISVEKLRSKDLIGLEAQLTLPGGLVRGAVLKEEDGGNVVGVLAAVGSFLFFHDGDIDGSLQHLLSADGSLTKHEVTVLGNGVHSLGISIGSKEVLIADEGGMERSGSVSHVQGEYPAAFSVLLCHNCGVGGVINESG